MQRLEDRVLRLEVAMREVLAICEDVDEDAPEALLSAAVWKVTYDALFPMPVPQSTIATEEK